MIAKSRRHITFANVCSALALIIALGTGTAYAADTVFSTDIVDGEVKTVDLAEGAVTSANVADGAIGQTQLASGAVGSGQLAPGAVGSGQLAPGAVGPGQIPADGIDGSKVANDSLTVADIRGADTLVSINVKAGAVPAGGCKDLKRPASGARVGEIALISVLGPLPAGTVVLAGRVPSSDNVAIKVCNVKRHGKLGAVKAVPARVVTLG
jgi:hypothetical protein